MRPRSLWSLLLAASLFGSVARADAGALRYRAPLDCPGEADFVRAVAARGGRFDGSAASRRRFDVTVTKDAAGYVGSFRIGRPEAASSERAVHAPTCLEVVDGLAVATALALHSDPEPAREPIHTAPVAPALVETPRAPADERAEDGPLQLGPAFTLTAFGGLSFGFVPSTPLPRYELSLTWASLARQGGSSRISGPVMRFGLNLYGGATYETAGATTKVGAQALTAGPCYAPVYNDRGLVLLTCLDLSAGLMGASTVERDSEPARSESFGFGSVGAGVEAVYNLGRHFHLALRGGANVLVAPIVFRGADGSELFRSSRYNGYLTLGAGGHF